MHSSGITRSKQHTGSHTGSPGMEGYSNYDVLTFTRVGQVGHGLPTRPKTPKTCLSLLLFGDNQVPSVLSYWSSALVDLDPRPCSRPCLQGAVPSCHRSEECICINYLQPIHKDQGIGHIKITRSFTLHFSLLLSQEARSPCIRLVRDRLPLRC